MNILVVGGSDTSSASGIQGDVKVLAELGVYSPSIITAVTSQNTVNYHSTHALSKQVIGDQFHSILSDFKIDAVKIGMVYNSEIIQQIHSEIKDLDAHIILDPVVKSTTQGELIKSEAINHYKKLLLPLAHSITPNVYEASILTGLKLQTKQNVRQAAQLILKMGVKHVIITGNEFEADTVSDLIAWKNNEKILSSRKINTENRGGGCRFACALATQLVKGCEIISAVKFAQKFTISSIKHAQKYTNGTSIVESPSNNHVKLSLAIEDFLNINHVSEIIPECQTNFVYSKNNPKSISDILGINGRIVKTGDTVMCAGELMYGSSKHVASAVLAMMKKFKDERSAVNIKFSEEIIIRAKNAGLIVAKYDRKLEPADKRMKENNTIFWGTTNAIKHAQEAPDLIYHMGDYGKEPMILIFATEPYKVISKINKLVL